MVSNISKVTRVKNKKKTLRYVQTLSEPFSRQEVADRVGFKMATVGTYFNDFVKEGFIERSNGIARNGVKLYRNLEQKPTTTTPKELLSRRWI